MVMVLIITGLILTLLETKSSRCGAEEYFRKILLKNIPDKYSRKIFQKNILEKYSRVIFQVRELREEEARLRSRLQSLRLGDLQVCNHQQQLLSQQDYQNLPNMYMNKKLLRFVIMPTVAKNSIQSNQIFIENFGRATNRVTFDYDYGPFHQIGL